MGEQKPEKTKKHICAGLLAHVSAEQPVMVSIPAARQTASNFFIKSLRTTKCGNAFAPPHKYAV